MDDRMDGEVESTRPEQQEIMDEAPDFPHALFVNVSTYQYESLRALSRSAGRHLSALTREALDDLFVKYRVTSV